MKVKSLIAGSAALLMALSPIAAQASMPLVVMVQGSDMADDGGDDDDYTIGVGFALLLVVLGIFATSDGDEPELPRTSP